MNMKCENNGQCLKDVEDTWACDVSLPVFQLEYSMIILNILLLYYINLICHNIILYILF